MDQVAGGRPPVARKPHRGKRRAHVSPELAGAVTRYAAGLRGVDESAIALVIEGVKDLVARCSFFVKGASYRLDGRLIAKQLPPPRAAEAYSILQQLREAGFVPGSPDGISVPEPYACLDGGILLMEDVAGRKFTKVIKRSHQVEPAKLAARILFKLHSSGISPPERSDPARLLASRTAANQSDLPLAAALEAISTRLRSRLTDYTAYATAPIHCDFHFNQFHISDGGAILLDTDGVSSGDPARDVGYFLASAYSRQRRLQDTEAIVTLFGAEYEKLAGAEVMRRVPAYEAVAFVYRAWKRLREGKSDEVRELLDLASDRLGRTNEAD
jgi:streptomycin 6-kinase